MGAGPLTFRCVFHGCSSVGAVANPLVALELPSALCVEWRWRWVVSGLGEWVLTFGGAGFRGCSWRVWW